MAQKSGFFNSVSGDRKYMAKEFADYFKTIVSTGVSPVVESLIVTANNTMQLIVSAGRAYIEGYYYNNDSDYALALDAADAVLNRIDRLILRLDYVNRTITLAVLKGIPASLPAASALTRNVDKYELCIAEVLVSAGVAGIAQAKVTDKRADVTVCGYMKGVVIFDGNEELAALQVEVETHKADDAPHSAYVVQKSAPEITGELNCGENTIGFIQKDNGNTGAAKTIDWKKSNKQKITVNANTILAFTPPSKPCNLVLLIAYTGVFTVTLPSCKYPGGTAPTFTSVASAIDILTLYYDGTNYYAMLSADWK